MPKMSGYVKTFKVKDEEKKEKQQTDVFSKRWWEAIR